MKSILENNILIAEFMGRKFRAYKGNHSYDQKFDTYEECLQAIRDNKWIDFLPELGWCTGSGKYHDQWSWLMPVVEKIAALEIVKETAVKSSGTRIWLKPNGFVQGLYYPDTMLLMCYRTVVTFIKWYNEQSK